MNQTELNLIVEELHRSVGQPFTGAWQPRRDRALIGVGDRLLLIVPRGPFARVHLTRARPKNPARPFSFQGACRAHLHGPLRAIHGATDDRVLDLDFAHGRLHLRLTGVRGGLWLLDGDRVLAAYDGPAPDQLPDLPPPPPIPQSAREARFTAGPTESVNRAAERYFGKREAEARRTERRHLMARRLKTQLARDRRLRRALEGDLAKADKADATRHRADALGASLHRVERGATEVLVPDPYDAGATVLIPLDPRKSPGDNLSALYRRAGRLDRMGERVLEHIERVEARVRSLQAAMVVVDDADDDTLDKLEDLVPSSRRGRSVPDDAPWIAWRAADGREILVGRNAKGNRRLTFQRARAKDWWMHLRGKPGAHVIVLCPQGRSPGLETLLAAAQIVGVHARIPEGVSYDVQYARLADVRSIKGAEDGRVTVHDERVLRVRRDPAELVGWQREDWDDLDVEGLRALL